MKPTEWTHYYTGGHNNWAYWRCKACGNLQEFSPHTKYPEYDCPKCRKKEGK